MRDNRLLMSVLQRRLGGIMLVFVLLYWNALPAARGVTATARRGVRRAHRRATHSVSVGVGLVSIVLALTLPIH